MLEINVLGTPNVQNRKTQSRKDLNNMITKITLIELLRGSLFSKSAVNTSYTPTLTPLSGSLPLWRWVQ